MFRISIVYRFCVPILHNFVYPPWFYNSIKYIYNCWVALAYSGISLYQSSWRFICLCSRAFPVSFVVHIGVLLQVFLRALSFRLSVISSPLLTLFHLPYVGSTVGPLDSSLHRDTVTVGPLDTSLPRDTVTLDRLYVQPIILGTSGFLRTVETLLSELHLTETRVNRNVCQALRFPELLAARHLWASRCQFAVKSWHVCFLQCSFNVWCDGDCKQWRLNETCCDDNWTEIGGCETNWKWRDLAKRRGGFRCWHINGLRLGKIETRRTFV